MNSSNSFSDQYEEKFFWDKIKSYAKAAGKDVIEKALVLYYCLHDDETPAWVKPVIVGALGYFIMPLDAIPDLIPGLGYGDDLGVLVYAFAVVAIHIKSGHKEKAKEQVKVWFG